MLFDPLVSSVFLHSINFIPISGNYLNYLRNVRCEERNVATTMEQMRLDEEIRRGYNISTIESMGEVYSLILFRTDGDLSC